MYWPCWGTDPLSVNHFEINLSLWANQKGSHLHTCWYFSLYTRGNWAIAKACEALSSLARFDVSIVSINQDVTQSFTLSKQMSVDLVKHWKLALEPKFFF